MGTSRENIRQWFISGKSMKNSHMLVVCDSFDYEDYPVYVKEGELAATARYQEYLDGKHSMQRVMEVYHLGSDMEAQLAEHRSFNFAPIQPPRKPVKREAPPTEHGHFLNELERLSKLARRNITGDFDWSAQKLRTVTESTRELCNLVDRYIEENR